MGDEPNQIAPVSAPAVPHGTLSGEELTFTWRHTHKLDAQKRVSFPAEWRPADPNFTFTLLLWGHPSAGRKFAFIKGLPPERFKQLLSRVDSGTTGAEAANAMRRRLFSNSVTLKLDPAGRLCLPPQMAADANLSKDVLFAGAGGEFEIWEPDLYEKCMAADEAIASNAITNI
jgi:MraZ protein